MMKRAFLISNALAPQFFFFLINSEMYEFQAAFPVLTSQDVQSSIPLGP